MGDSPSTTVDKFDLLCRQVQQLDKDVRDLRDDIGRLTERLAVVTPTTGEISLSRVGPAARWSFLALIGVLVFFGQHIWQDLDHIDTTVQGLQEFRAAGGRATAGDLLVVTRCVRRRFEERIRGLDEGAPLAHPDITARELLEECSRDLLELEERLDRRNGSLDGG